MELFKTTIVFIAVFIVAALAAAPVTCPVPPAYSDNTYGSHKFTKQCGTCPYVKNVDLDFIDRVWYQQVGTVSIGSSTTKKELNLFT